MGGHRRLFARPGRNAWTPLGSLPTTLDERRKIVRLYPRAGSALAATLAVVNLLLGVLPVAFVVETSLVLGRVPEVVADGTDSPAWDSLVAVFVAAALTFLAQQVLAPLATSLGELLARRIDGSLYLDLMSAALRSPGIAALEDDEIRGHLRVAAAELESGVQSPGQAGVGLLALLARYTQLIGYVVVVGALFSWLAAAGLTVAVMLFRHGQRGGMSRYAKERVRLAPFARVADYLRKLAIQAPAAKEIRIFGLAGWLRDQLTDATLQWLRPLWKARRRVYLWPFLWFGLWALLVVTALFASLGWTASSGSSASSGLTLTSFVLVAQCVMGALRLAQYYPEADLQIAVGMSAHDALDRFVRAVAAFPARYTPPALPAPDGETPDGETPDGQTPDGWGIPPLAHSIEFDDVTFRYPGQNRVVFDRLNLTIPVGRCTAIVGVNGAGKTTLIKLLARLYEPTGGAIRADGADIRSYSIDAWRARLGVIFQDFVRYEVSATDNIGFGAVEHRDDLGGIRQAASAMGLTEVLDGLPRGMDTPLVRHVAGGADLSGGQWQRVALARAWFALRHGSTVVVLDEPTASLDVRAEANFFAEFAQLTRGATTLLISHRFATVRHADHIVVLEHGRVLEQGGHDELMAHDGRYAELFRLQADRFTGGPADREPAHEAGGLPA